MAKFIRFRVQTLILVLIVCLFLYGLNYMFTPSIMMYIAEKYESNQQTEMALNYYDRINRYFPKHWETPKAIERYIVHSQDYIMVNPESYGSGGASTLYFKGTPSEKEFALLQRLAEGFPKTFQGKRAVEYLTMYQLVQLMEDQQYEEALKKYDDFFKENRGTYGHENVKTTTLVMVNLLRNEGLDQEALDILNNFTKRFSAFNDYRIEELQGDLLVELGKIEDAKKIYQKIIKFVENVEVQKDHQSPREGRPVEIDWQTEVITRVEKKIQQSKMKIEKGSIKGRITLKGKSLEGVQITLQSYDHKGRVSLSLGEPDALWSISDSKGEFDFSGLYSGNYALGFVIGIENLDGVTLEGGRFPKSFIEISEGEDAYWDFNLIESMKVEYPTDNALIEGEEINFKWQPVEGASYYTLNLGKYQTQHSGTMITNRGVPIYDHQTTVSSAEFLWLGGDFHYDPTTSYFWGVDAHDDHGRIINSSLGYIKGQNTDFTLKKLKLRVGDQYLLDGEKQKALEAFKEDLKKNPDDFYASYMIMRLNLRPVDTTP